MAGVGDLVCSSCKLKVDGSSDSGHMANDNTNSSCSWDTEDVSISRLHLGQHQFDVMTLCSLLNSTQRASMDAGVKTPQSPHLSSHFKQSLLYIKYYNQLDSRTDLSPIPGRSAVKSYKTSSCIQNLSKRALNRQTVSTLTTELGRLFQILTIQAVKEYFRVS